MVVILAEVNGHSWIQFFYSKTYVVLGWSLSWKEQCRRCLFPQRVLKIAVEMLLSWFWCLTVQDEYTTGELTAPVRNTSMFTFSLSLVSFQHLTKCLQWRTDDLRKSDSVPINNNWKKDSNLPQAFYNFLHWYCLSM